MKIWHNLVDMHKGILLIIVGVLIILSALGVIHIKFDYFLAIIGLAIVLAGLRLTNIFGKSHTHHQQ